MQKMLSGIKPTGKLHIGNYIGAISQFINFQEDYHLYIFIANLHALTVEIDPLQLQQNTKDLIALYIALGLDPKKVTIFLQSDIPSHSELYWILTCNTMMGELNRMTQYKDKIAKNQKNIGAGIFNYPILMAADILLYDADFVPVGIDQKQHVELTKVIAQRFNHRYGETFKIPEVITPKYGAKIMSLQKVENKMSKSFDDKKGTIDLLDDPQVARKKIMSAQTDSLNRVKYDPENQKGISNLINILANLSGQSIDEIEKKYQNQTSYKQFKQDVADQVVDFLTKVQSKYQEIINSDLIEQVLEKGKQEASEIAKRKIKEVYQKVGLKI